VPLRPPRPADQWWAGRDPAELAALAGHMRQLCGVDSCTETEGPARGARRVRVTTGSGLVFDVHPDRCLDIGAVSWRGMPVAWLSPAGFPAPSGYGPDDWGWPRAFGGGLVATCGLDHFGPPALDEDRRYGQHGRATALAAEHLATRAEWTEDGTYLLEVRGQVRQSQLFGENLVLRRTVRGAFGSDTVTVEDAVTNEGHEPQPHMILYHANLGWPLLDAGAELTVPGLAVHPRDEVARAGLDGWDRFAPPEAGYREQVFRHELAADEPVEVRLRNPRLGVCLALSFHTGQLPALFQWKMLGPGTYVLGVEPANCAVIGGRARARAAGLLPVLQPGESRRYRLDFTIGAA
jgi:hypothetical protein